MAASFLLTFVSMTREEKFMLEAIALSEKGVENNEGGPFGCIIVRGDEIVGRGNNMVLVTKDPTAHAEVVAIRDACRNLDTFQLDDCELYASCEPCPMCLGAIYWARPKVVYYCNTREDASVEGFDDSLIYNEVSKPLDDRQIPFRKLTIDGSKTAFGKWHEKTDKIKY